MLARNIKTAQELGITDAEHTALLDVLKCMETGNLVHVSIDDDIDHKGPNLFNMNRTGSGCGTPACIGGWVAAFMGQKTGQEQDRYVCGGHSDALHDLYWDDRALSDDTTVDQAAAAVRSFIATGEANWDEALDG